MRHAWTAASALLLALVAHPAAAGSVSSVPNDYLRADDVARLSAALRAARRSDGTFGSGSAEDTLYALKALEALGASAKESGAKKACAALSSRLSADSVSDAYFFAAAGCKGLKMTPARRRALESAISGSSGAEGGFMAVSAVEAAGRAGDFDYAPLKSAMSALRDPSTGNYRASRDAEKPDAISTAYASLALALAGMPLSDKATALVKLSRRSGDIQYFSAPGKNRLAATSWAVRAAVARPGLKSAQASRIASFILANKYVQDPEDVYNLITAVDAMSGPNAKYRPVAVSLVYDKGAASAVAVTDIKGNPVDGAVTLLTSTLRATLKTDASNEKLPKGNKLDKYISGKAPGFYDIQLKVEPKPGAGVSKKTLLASRAIRVPSAARPAKLSASVSKPKGKASAAASATAVYPDTLSTELSTSDARPMLRVRLSLDNAAGFRPEQAVVRLVDSKTGRSVSFAMKGAAGQDLTADINTALLNNGAYAAEVVLGDPLLQSAVRWGFANVGVTTANRPVTSTANPTDEMQAKPELNHTFQEQARPGSGIIATIFTAVVLAPLAALAVGIQRLGLKVVFPSGGEAIWALLFQGSLLAIVGLNAMYFLSLNIFEALAGLLVLSAVATVTGYKALNGVFARSQASKQ